MLFQPRLGLMLLLVLLLTSSLSAKPASHKPAPHKPASHAPVSKSPPARRELQAIYNKMNAEAMQRNADALYDYNSDDYVLMDAKGRVYDAAEGRQDLTAVLDQVDSIRAVTTIEGFSGTDTEATVTIKDRAVIGLANNANGRAIKFTFNDTARDHWIKTEEGWRRTRTRILTGKNAYQKNF